MKQGFFDFYPDEAPFDASPWRRALLPPQLSEKLEEQEKQELALQSKHGLPTGLMAVQLFAMLGAALLIVAAVMSGNTVLLLGSAVGIAVYIALHIVGKRRAKAGTATEEAQALAAQRAELETAVRAALGIPEDAVQVDILRRCWQPGDEERGGVVQLGDYGNHPRFAWVSDGRLHLADSEESYAFALDSLGIPAKVDTKILLPRWNKPEPPQSAAYRHFRLTVSAGGVYCRPFFEVAVGDTGKVLRFPAYEMPVLLKLTGLGGFAQS